MARAKKQKGVVELLNNVARAAQKHIHTWQKSARAGNEWLQAREQGRGWMQLALRAWREKTERNGGRGGHGMSARAWQVRWAPARRGRGKAATGTSPSDAFPRFPSPEEATRVLRRIRAVTTYMRVTHTLRIDERKARTRRAIIQRVAEEGARHLAEERARLEEQRRREAERQERLGRTEGPAARTRRESTQSMAVVPEREQRVVTGVKRRTPTHTSARVGRVVVELMVCKRPRFGDG